MEFQATWSIDDYQDPLIREVRGTLHQGRVCKVVS